MWPGFSGRFVKKLPLLLDGGKQSSNERKDSQAFSAWTKGMLGAGGGRRFEELASGKSELLHGVAGSLAESGQAVRLKGIPGFGRAVGPPDEQAFDVRVVSQAEMHANITGAEVA